ncbi:hypothetical protein [Streptomyces thioluteus]|uniref:hypothetical protein n=1 Tax=Streptomyces thioluteus TaxID=66431 RepID=UPI003CD09799
MRRGGDRRVRVGVRRQSGTSLEYAGSAREILAAGKAAVDAGRPGRGGVPGPAGAGVERALAAAER